MNKLSTFRRYKISHNVIHFYNVPNVDPNEAFIGIEVLNTGYHPITIVECGCFDKDKNCLCVPWIGVDGIELPLLVPPGESHTLPASINELKKNDLKSNDIQFVYVRDSLGKFTKQKFNNGAFSNNF